jgi:hypothetical protein
LFVSAKPSPSMQYSLKFLIHRNRLFALNSFKLEFSVRCLKFSLSRIENFHLCLKF